MKKVACLRAPCVLTLRPLPSKVCSVWYQWLALGIAKSKNKAKIGALQDIKPTTGTTSKKAGSNSTTLISQAKYKSTSNQGTRATTTAKHPEARAAATQKDMPPCGRTERTMQNAGLCQLEGPSCKRNAEPLLLINHTPE